MYSLYSSLYCSVIYSMSSSSIWFIFWDLHCIIGSKCRHPWSPLLWKPRDLVLCTTSSIYFLSFYVVT